MIDSVEYRTSMDTQRTQLQVGVSDLAIGEYSVGLAPSRTSEQLVEAYLELIGLVRQHEPEYMRDEDFEVLSISTGLDAGFLRNRVTSQLRSVRVA